MEEQKIFWAVWLKENRFLTNKEGRVLQFTTKELARGRKREFEGSQTCRGLKMNGSLIINEEN